MSLLWLILRILLLLLIVAVIFYRLGMKSVRGEVAKVQQDKQNSIEREQSRTDETVQKLKEAEEQILSLTTQYEQLERSAVPRRKLNEAEARNNFLEKELARLGNNLPASTPTPVPAPAPPVPAPEPTLEPTPPITPTEAVEESKSAAEPETLTLSSPPAKVVGESIRRSRRKK
jgi:hypothetical protein